MSMICHFLSVCPEETETPGNWVQNDNVGFQSDSTDRTEGT